MTVQYVKASGYPFLHIPDAVRHSSPTQDRLLDKQYPVATP